MDSQDDTPVAEHAVPAVSSPPRQDDRGRTAEPDPGWPPVPTTDDPAVDGVIAELADVRGLALDAHIEAGEKAHRVLQARLSDLGGE